MVFANTDLVKPIMRYGLTETIFIDYNKAKFKNSDPPVVKKVWRGWDLNPHPRAYESPAPPLSYLA
jgi:hypothetical protein